MLAAGTAVSSSSFRSFSQKRNRPYPAIVLRRVRTGKSAGYRFRFERYPTLSRREDRQISARQERQSTRGTLVMDVLRVVWGRPLFRAVSAFLKLCARKDPLRHQSLCI